MGTRPIDRPGRSTRAVRGSACALALCACASALAGAAGPAAPARAAQPPPTEYQIKALFLVNFTRYVDWPPGTLAEAGTPVVVCIAGERPAVEEVASAAGPPGRGRRPIVARRVHGVEAADDCHVLFIAESQEAWLGAMLERVRRRPVLTVGETEQFARQGGIITLFLRAGRVRLGIDAAAARLAGLTISSRLLQVADVVSGRPN